MTKEEEIRLMDKANASAVPYLTASFDTSLQRFVLVGQHPILLDPVGIHLSMLHSVSLARLILQVAEGQMVAAEANRGKTS